LEDLSALYDMCTTSFIQFTDFLRAQSVDLSRLQNDAGIGFSVEVRAQIFRPEPTAELFWQLALKDLLHPMEQYMEEVCLL
jgi:hypothetical protein